MKSLGVSTVFALIVLATPAIASGTASVYMNLYPEYRAQEFSGPTGAGAEVGHLTTMRAGSSILDKTSSAKAGAQEIEWSNSYVGVRALTSLTSQLLVGVDAQVLVDLSGSFVDNVAFRDAFFFVEHTTWGPRSCVPQKRRRREKRRCRQMSPKGLRAPAHLLLPTTVKSMT